MKRSEKDLLMKRVGRWLGIGYRFHRLQGLHGPLVIKTKTNDPRHWRFEFWKKIPGNPRNCFSKWEYDKFARQHKDERVLGCGNDKQYRLEQSELKYIYIPESLVKKDDVIQWLLFESDFIQQAGGPSVRSMSELNLHLDVAFVPEKI